MAKKIIHRPNESRLPAQKPQKISNAVKTNIFHIHCSKKEDEKQEFEKRTSGFGIGW